MGEERERGRERGGGISSKEKGKRGKEWEGGGGVGCIRAIQLQRVLCNLYN